MRDAKQAVKPGMALGRVCRTAALAAKPELKQTRGDSGEAAK
jgi:hypothetical protein